MSTIEKDREATVAERAERMKALKERADRFSSVRDIETIRERHGLPDPKKQSPK